MSAHNLLRTLSRSVINISKTSSFFSNAKIVSNGVSTRFLSTTPSPKTDKETVKITFLMQDGQRIETEGNINDSLLDVVINNDLNIDGFGACEGTLTCSTCHVILKQEDYDRIPNAPLDEERDMLDLAYGLTDTSRLGCQILLTKELEGLEVQIPETINDAR